jgi:hypothetical protein
LTYEIFPKILFSAATGRPGYQFLTLSVESDISLTTSARYVKKVAFQPLAIAFIVG